jgi:hypothetical protein
MLVIGNGESRKDIPIDAFKMLKIGCNAIHRDMDVDFLVCCDRRMVREAIDTGYVKPIYTRSCWQPFRDNPWTPGIVQELPPIPYEPQVRADEEMNWGSGTYALLVGVQKAKEQGDNTVHFIGFDLWGNDGKQNNLYKGTDHYVSADSKATEPKFWVHQIAKLIEIFPDIKFIAYQKADWLLPKSWCLDNFELKILDNVVFDSIY